MTTEYYYWSITIMSMIILLCFIICLTIILSKLIRRAKVKE